jgi:hypothetical protein
MAELNRVAGRPTTATIKGKEYKLSVLTIDDLADFEKRVKDERLEKAIGSLQKAKVDPETIAKAAENMLNKELTIEQLQEAMGTVSGTRYLLWCALKQNHDVKLENMGDLVDLDNIDDVTGIIQNLGGKAAEKAKNSRRGRMK